jgi:hypothetical protein
MTEPMAAECLDGCHWQTHLCGGRAPLDVRTCQLCGSIDWEDLAEQVAGIRESIATALLDKAEQVNGVHQRRRAIGLDDQAHEAAIRSRTLRRAAEIVRECNLTAGAGGHAGRTYWFVDDDSKTVHTALVDPSHPSWPGRRVEDC